MNTLFLFFKRTFRTVWISFGLFEHEFAGPVLGPYIRTRFGKRWSSETHVYTPTYRATVLPTSDFLFAADKPYEHQQSSRHATDTKPTNFAAAAGRRSNQAQHQPHYQHQSPNRSGHAASNGQQHHNNRVESSTVTFNEGELFLFFRSNRSLLLLLYRRNSSRNGVLRRNNSCRKNISKRYEYEQ